MRRNWNYTIRKKDGIDLMQINRTTDYALRILICLGKENRTVPSSEIANSMKISQRYLLSIARGLKNQGYTKVGFGPDGGYSLARPLNMISLYDIIILMEGTVTISRCLTQETHCEETPCVLHEGYSFLQNIIECYLRNLTIDMLVNQSTDTWQKTIVDKLDEILRQNQEKGNPPCQ